MDIISKYGDYDVLVDGVSEERELFKRRYMSDLNRYSGIIGDYKSFLYLTSAFLKEITIKDNFINTALTISLLLNMFSYKNKFEISNARYIDVVTSMLGINVIYGKGCCRHCASFGADIFKEMGLSVENFYCKLDEKPIKHQIHEPAHHMANLIEYDGNKYVFDIMNGVFFKFISATELKNFTNDLYLSYLPRILLLKEGISVEELESRLVLYDKESKKEQLSAKEYVEILKETRSKLDENSKIISDYKHDSEPIKKKIYAKSRNIKEGLKY